MNDSKIPVRYAKALFDLATDKKVTDQVYKDMINIQKIVQLKDVHEMLLSPVIPGSQKNKILKKVMTVGFQDITMSFIDMVFKNKREIYFNGIAHNYIQRYKSSKNIKSVELTTAVKIKESHVEVFKAQVLKTYKATIEMVEKVDPDIVGGFVIQVDDILYDASVKRQLRNIEQELIKEKI